MGKKCIPGAGICIENMTLFIMTFSLIIFTYLYYVHVVKPQYNSNNQNSNPQIIIVSPLSSQFQ